MIGDLDRVLHTRAGRRVEYFSIAWTSLEAIIGVTVGILAGSVALIGFGADSIIEGASIGRRLFFRACRLHCTRRLGGLAETRSAARHLLRHHLCDSVCNCHAST